MGKKDFYENKRILIVGGTGTIGNGLIKKLLTYNPKVIRILSRDEYKQFNMQQELENEDLKKMRFFIGDVRDYDRVNRAMDGVDIVFNLAAMKHVMSCEYDPDEAIKTNVIGMENVIKAANNNDVECVIFTSSDKAINPVNSYGATKMLAEKLVQAANYSSGGKRTKFIAVRFGNVMGSRGSVIPLFKKQILEKGEITITDPTMSRFMMTLSEAVNLMLTAGKESFGGEIFVLKMPVINIKDLSEVIIEETSKKYNIDKNMVDTKIIGLRAGEKMYEELMTKDESHFAYELKDMYAITPNTFSKEKYIEFYNKNKKCEIKDYNSEGVEKIGKEEVREWIISEGLI